MSDNITRISLAEAFDGDRTDWSRLRAMDEAAIEAGIAADPDTFTLSDHAGAGQAAARYEIYRQEGRAFRWRLLGADGSVLADGAKSYSTKGQARKAIDGVRAALLNASIAA